MKLVGCVESVKSVTNKRGQARDVVQVIENVGGRCYLYDLYVDAGRFRAGDGVELDVVWDVRYRSLRLADAGQ